MKHLSLPLLLLLAACSTFAPTEETRARTAAAQPPAPAAIEGEWTLPAVVGRDGQVYASYQARIEGRFLVVAVEHGPGWHSYAMDNELRHQRALAGRPSLGVELPTVIEVQGSAVRGGWLQTEPEDFSKPEMHWFTWGFGGTAHFVTELEDPTRALTLSIHGQICDAATCADVDVTLHLDPTLHRGSRDTDRTALVAVASAETAEPAASH